MKNLQGVKDNNNKFRQHCMEKVIQWELCKKLKFHLSTICHMYKSESAPKNERHKILWDFKIQTHHLIRVRRPDPVIINKNKELAVLRILPSLHIIENKQKRKDKQVFRPFQRIKKSWNMGAKAIAVITGSFGTVPKDLEWVGKSCK